MTKLGYSDFPHRAEKRPYPLGLVMIQQFFAWLRLFFPTAKENPKSDSYSILTEPLRMKGVFI